MDDQAIVTKVDNTDITADNFSEKLNNSDATIIVQSGSTAEAFAQENFPKAKIVPYKDATECFSALQSDKGDAVVTNRSVASQLTAEQFNTCQTIKRSAPARSTPSPSTRATPSSRTTSTRPSRT